jgi:hypothetical protein
MNPAQFVWFDRGWWLFPDQQRRLLTWNQATKQLQFCALHRFEDDRVLARFDNEAAVAAATAGWEEHNITTHGLAWLHSQLVLTKEPDPAGLAWLERQADRQANPQKKRRGVGVD